MFPELHGYNKSLFSQVAIMHNSVEQLVTSIHVHRCYQAPGVIHVCTKSTCIVLYNYTCGSPVQKSNIILYINDLVYTVFLPLRVELNWLCKLINVSSVYIASLNPALSECSEIAQYKHRDVLKKREVLDGRNLD